MKFKLAVPATCAALVSASALLGLGADGVTSAAGERTWYVSTTGSDGADGSSDAPLQTLGSAVDRASSGDAIVIAGGVYRESVQIFGKALDISSAPGERAVLDGARAVGEWRASGGDWVANGWTPQFYREQTGGTVSGDNHIAGYPDQLFIDGFSLQQVLSRQDVVPGTFFHDTAADQLWIGSDPSGRRVEASHLSYGIYFNQADGSSLTGVTVRRYATEARDMAAVRAYSNDLVFRDVTVRANARIGFSAIGSDIYVTDSQFTNNGFIGVHGDRLDGFVLEKSAVQFNNREGFDDFHSAAGVKLTNSTGVTIRDNDVSRNDGPGVWTDLDTSQVTIARNLLEDNARAGVEVELSDRVNVLSNVALGNGEAGIWVLESTNVQVLHNASFDNVNGIEVEEGPRREVANVRVENNTIGDAAAGSRALIDVNDWTAERSASQMGVSFGHNAYWIPDTADVSTLGRVGLWPNSIAESNNLDELRSSTGQGVNSTLSRSSSNPYVVSMSSSDYRWLASEGRATPLTPGAADALGVQDGARLSIGPIAPVVRR